MNNNNNNASLRSGPNNDFVVSDSPSETVSSLGFNNNGNLLVAGSWDNNVRIYEVQHNASQNMVATRAKTMMKDTHKQPILDCCFASDGATVYTASCDGTAKAWHLGSDQCIQIAQHDAPIKSIAHIPEMNAIVTGSWDKTLRYWDHRQPKEIAKVQLPERVYSMDVRHPLLVCGLAERKMMVFDLRNPQAPFKQFDSALKMQTRCVAAFPNKAGFAYGSIEGRVAVTHVDDKMKDRNFAFKCHRVSNSSGRMGNTTEVYAVNSIAFHPYGTFATAGSDGNFIFWDKDEKHRLKIFKQNPNPITAAKFSPNGGLYAYACGYDWSKGHEHYDRSKTTCMYLHCVRDSEIKQR